MRHWPNPFAIAKVVISFDSPKAFWAIFQRKEATNENSRL